MNKEEYISLRSEIISLVNIQCNTVAIITLAIQQKNEWIFLLPYIILFSFQRLISAKRNVMLRIAAYIAVFLDGDFGWEKNYSEITDNTLNKHNDKEKFSKFKDIVFGRISSLQLGVVCSVGCIITCVMHIAENKKWYSWSDIMISNISFIEIFPALCAMILFCGLADLCKGALKAMKVRDTYIESLQIYKRNLEQEKRNEQSSSGK